MLNCEDITEAEKTSGAEGAAASAGPLSHSLRELEPAWGVLQEERQAIRELQSRVAGELDAIPESQESTVLHEGLTDFMEILDLEDERLSQIERDVADLGQILSRLRNDVQSHQSWLSAARLRIEEQRDSLKEGVADCGPNAPENSATVPTDVSDVGKPGGQEDEQTPDDANDHISSQKEDEIDFWESTEAAKTLANFDQLGDLVQAGTQDQKVDPDSDARGAEVADGDQPDVPNAADTDWINPAKLHSEQGSDADQAHQSATDLAHLFAPETGESEERWTAESDESASGVGEIPASIIEDPAASAVNSRTGFPGAELPPGNQLNNAELRQDDSTQHPQLDAEIVSQASPANDGGTRPQDVGPITTESDSLAASPSAGRTPYSGFDQQETANSQPAHLESANQSQEQDDATNPDTISAYMERLLKQYGGSSSSVEVDELADMLSGQSVQDESANEILPKVNEQLNAEPPEQFSGSSSEFVELTPRHDKESIRAGISSMRELANLQAREALKTHKWSVSRKPMILRGFIATAAALLAAAFLTSELWSPVPLLQLAWPIVLMAGVGASEFFRSAVEFRNQLKAENNGRGGLIVRLVDIGFPLPLRFAVGSAAAAAGVGLQFSPQIFQMDLMRYGWSVLAFAGVFFLDVVRSIYEGRLERSTMPRQNGGVSEATTSVIADTDLATVTNEPGLSGPDAEGSLTTGQRNFEMESLEGPQKKAASDAPMPGFDGSIPMPAVKETAPGVEEGTTAMAHSATAVEEPDHEQPLEPDLMSVFESAAPLASDRSPHAES